MSNDTIFWIGLVAILLVGGYASYLKNYGAAVQTRKLRRELAQRDRRDRRR